MNKKELIVYNIDASRLVGKSENVVFPKSIQEVQYMVKSSSFDIVPRGSGCGLVGGAVPNNSIVIDLSKMNKVSDFNQIRKTVRVEAGVTIKELNEKLLQFGFEFPIYFFSQETSTIGAMIATNSPGDRSMKYGVTKDWIEEIEFVNGKGESMKTTKADLLEVCGMEGVTGIICAATLKVIPIMKRTASVFQSDKLEEVLSVARRLRAEKEVSMIEFFSKDVSLMLGFPEKYNMIIEFDSDRGKIKGNDYNELMNKSKKTYSVLYSKGYYNSEDPRFFFDTIKDFVEFLEDNKVPYFGYLGNGIIYAFFKDNEKTMKNNTHEIIKKLKVRLGEYGYGLTRKEFLDTFEQKVVQRIKNRHDPLNKLNKGKMIDIDSTPKRVEAGKKESSVDYNVNLGEQKSADEFLKQIQSENTQLENSREKSIAEMKVNRKDSSEIKTETGYPKNIDSVINVSPPEKVIDPIQKKVEVQENIQSKNIERREISPDIKEKIKEYEYTFKPEVDKNEIKEIEKFAKTIPREIDSMKNENTFMDQRKIISSQEKTVSKLIESTKPVQKENSAPIDYTKINQIMTNRFSGEGKPQEQTTSKVVMTDNFDRLRVENQKISSSDIPTKNNIGLNSEKEKEKELIDKIMRNQFFRREDKK